VSLDGSNHLLLAAHKNSQSGLRPKNEQAQWGNNSEDDGVDNTQKILNAWSSNTSDSAAHYCKNDLSIGSGSSKLMQWYLPAIAELKLALNGWNHDIFILPKESEPGYYSSTRDGNKPRAGLLPTSSKKTTSNTTKATAQPCA